MRRVQVGDVVVEEQPSGGLRVQVGSTNSSWSGQSTLTVQRHDERDLLLAVNAYFCREPARSDT